MGTLVRDIRYGLRALRRAPGFALIAALTIGLGVGAIGAVLSMANAILWRPLPVRDADRLVMIYAQRATTGEYSDFSYPDFVDFQASPAFEQVIGYYPVAVSLGLSGAGERAFGEMVSGNYFSALGVSMALGRSFSAEEGTVAGSPPATIVSYAFWRARLDADPRAVGRTVRMNGQDFTVIGVAPPEFHGVYYLGFQAQFWVPAQQYPLLVPGSPGGLSDRGRVTFRMMGRLRPGVGLPQANQAVAAVATSLASIYPRTNSGLGAVAMWEPDARPEPAMAGGTKLFFAVLLGVAVLVVLVAAANVASLLLARAVTREREISVRLALGASRRRLVVQLLTESLVLASLGGALGLLFAELASRLLMAIIRFPTDIPFALEFPLDFRVVGLTGLATLGAAVVFGVIPGLQASNTSLTASLKEGSGTGHGTRRARLRSALVIAQVGASCLLLVGTGLGLRTMLAIRAVNPGFSTANALLVTVNPGLIGYDAKRGERFYETLLDRVRVLPGVEQATVAGELPLEFSARGGLLFAESAQRPAPGAEGDPAWWVTVAPGYFGVMGNRLLAGREFSAGDSSTALQVAVVSEALARRYWPDQSPIGRRLHLDAPDAAPLEIVGVVADVKVRTLTESPAPLVYRPLAQDYIPSATLLLRTRVEPHSLAPAVRDAVRELDPDVPIADIKSFTELLEGRALLIPRFAAMMTGALGGLAVLLAVLGLYGLVTYTVSQRRRELGVRVALGASSRDIVRLVVRGGMRLAGIGVLLGLLAAMVLSSLVQGLLFGVSAVDPVVLVGIGLLLLSVTLIASWIPARRAAKVEPMSVLRSE